MKKFQVYIGNIYKMTKAVNNIQKEININYSGLQGLFCKGSDIIVPASVEGFNDTYEIYKKDTVLIKLEEHPLSSYLELESDQEFRSFPTGINSLFVEPEQLRAFFDEKEAQEDISCGQLIKKIGTKNKAKY